MYVNRREKKTLNGLWGAKLSLDKGAVAIGPDANDVLNYYYEKSYT